MEDEVCVVVIRMNTGEDILAILLGESEGILNVEHPHYVKFDNRVGIMLIPYCQLTDEKYFEIPAEKTQFLVTASRNVAYRYLDCIDELEAKYTEDIITNDAPLESLEAALKDNNYVSGNDTLH